MKRSLPSLLLLKYLSILSVTCFFSLSLKAQDYYWKNTGNPSFFKESNWSVGTIGGSAPAANSINANKAINSNITIIDANSLVGPVYGNIWLGSGTINLENSQLVLNTNLNKGIHMGSGKVVNLNTSRLHTQFIVNGTVTLSNSSELLVYGEVNPLNNTVVNIADSRSKVYFKNIDPRDVIEKHLSKISVNGLAAVDGQNVYVKNDFEGTVIYPISLDAQAMTAYSWVNYGGPSVNIAPFELYTDANVPLGDNVLSSFILRKGYMAVLAENANGLGARKVFIADKDDIHVDNLNAYGLNNKVSQLRIMPWRNVNKKGNAGGTRNDLNGILNVDWFYDWGNSLDSEPERQFVPMKWSAVGIASGEFDELIENYASTRDINTVLAFNEPDPCNDQSGQYNNLCDPEFGVLYYKELLRLGLRVGAPAVVGIPRGYRWLDSFMTLATEQGVHVDFIPVHYYLKEPTTTVMNRWKAISDKWNLPIWVTEFNYGHSPFNANSPTEENHRAMVQSYVNAMDEAEWLERYAFFSFGPASYYGFFSNIGEKELNTLGQYWQGHQAARAYPNFSQNTDCNGTNAGLAYVDDCGICVSGNTKKIANESCENSAKEVSELQASLEESKNLLYPNPVAEMLFIKNRQENTGSLKILNLQGNTLITKQILQSDEAISVGALSPGIYIVQIGFKNALPLITKIIKE